MKIEIRCNDCDKHLAILNKTIVPGVDTLRLDVAPCGNVDCNNCTGCEDAEKLQKAREEIVELKNKMLGLQSQLNAERPIA